MLVTLTFDDGDKSHYTKFYKVLKKYDLKATFYIVTSRVNNPFMMTWDDIRDLYDNGNEIGSHSCTHIDLTMISDRELDSELKESKRILSEYNASTLAYPYGRHDDKVIALARKYYSGARATGSVPTSVQWRYNTYIIEDRLENGMYNLNSIDMEFSSQCGFSLLHLPCSEFATRMTTLIDPEFGSRFWLILTFHGAWLRLSPKRFIDMFRGIMGRPFDMAGVPQRMRNRLRSEIGTIRFAMANFDWLCDYLQKSSIEVVTISEGINFLRKRKNKHSIQNPT
jgi:peptidoglycan/xylan/chitin deacetylase (PgdA/CDA1 family)